MPFDANDPDTKAALKAAIEEAVEAANSEFDDKSKRLLDDLKKAKADLRKVSDIKPEDVAALEAEVDTLKGKLTTAEKAAKDATAVAEKAAKSLETESAFTAKLLKQDGIKTQLIANGVKDETYIADLTDAFSSKVAIKVEGDDRVAMVGDKTLADHMKEWAGSDAGKKYVAANVNGGGGAGGGKQGDANVKTMTRTEYNALGDASAAQVAAGQAAAKGELKIVDAA